MGTEGKLTIIEFEEIMALVEKALYASNKKSAEQYIKRLYFMKGTLNIEPKELIIYGELVSYVSAASGQVRDKRHWINAINQSVFKLKPSGANWGIL